MKKVLFLLAIVVLTFSLVACGEEVKEPETNTPESEVDVSTNTNDENQEEVGEPVEQEDISFYDKLIEDYKLALDEYDLENVNADEEILSKYPLVSTTILMHAARYGLGTTTTYCDINGDGKNELLVGGDGAIGAIYAYNDSGEAVKIYFQDTLERGTLSVYDNGIIFSEGAGGAALHYYEFGKIGEDGISYEQIEHIEEEYTSENEAPTYKDVNTGTKLDYTSLDEIMEKYIADAQEI